MTHTALATDEPEPRDLATGGIVPAGSVPLVGEDGCSLPIPANTATMDASGRVLVRFVAPLEAGHWTVALPRPSAVD